jgi:hypothetical protein
MHGMTNGYKEPKWWQTGGSLETTFQALFYGAFLLALLGGALYIVVHFIVKYW